MTFIAIEIAVFVGVVSVFMRRYVRDAVAYIKAYNERASVPARLTGEPDLDAWALANYSTRSWPWWVMPRIWLPRPPADEPRLRELYARARRNLLWMVGIWMSSWLWALPVAKLISGTVGK